MRILLTLSVLSGFSAVLLIALWIRSFWIKDAIVRIESADAYVVVSSYGTVYVSRQSIPIQMPSLRYSSDSVPEWIRRRGPFVFEGNVSRQQTYIIFPHLVLVIAFGTSSYYLFCTSRRSRSRGFPVSVNDKVLVPGSCAEIEDQMNYSKHNNQK